MLCPQGRIGNNGKGRGSVYCKVCSGGTYEGEDRTKCIDCPAGYYCPETGDNAGMKNICNNGWYCKGTKNKERSICPKGAACKDTGAVDMYVGCVGNEYQGEEGKNSCDVCDGGKYITRSNEIGNLECGSCVGVCSTADCTNDHCYCPNGINMQCCDPVEYIAAEDKKSCMAPCVDSQKWDGTQCVDKCTGEFYWNGTDCASRCAASQYWTGSGCAERCTGCTKWNG